MVCTVCLWALPWALGLCVPCGSLLPHTCEAPGERFCALFYYALPIREAIHAFKFRQQWYWGRFFIRLLSSVLRAMYRPPYPVLLPMPMSVERLQSRGRDHCQWLARRLDWPWVGDALLKIRDTPPQHQLRGHARSRLSAKHFAWRGSRLPRHYVLFDDVVTTGHTLSAAKGVIPAGSRVDVLVIAKTLVKSR